MARAKAPPPEQAILSPDQMRAAIPRFQARIDELKAAVADIGNINERGEAGFLALEDKIDETLRRVFGAGTVQYDRYSVHSLCQAPLRMGGVGLGEIRQGYEEGIADAIARLSGIIEFFQEELTAEPDNPEVRAKRAFGDLDLHPEIARACTKLYSDGHYANAVEDACKVLDGLVKIRGGEPELSGTDLMQKVFSPKNPILVFNALASPSEKSEQQGMMFLYAGTMLALRNPRAHELIQDDPESALEYIGLINLLVRSLDRATRT